MSTIIPRHTNSRRVSTGIKDLDRIIQGGFLRGKSYLVSGPPGAGKSIFALQFVWASLWSAANCVYVSINEKPEDLLVSSLALGWDLEPVQASGRLVFLDVSPYFANMAHREGQRADVRKLMADLAKHVKGSQAECLVMDPINSIFTDSTEPGAAAFARAFVFAAEDYLSCTTLLTLNQWDHTHSSIQPIESCVSGIIRLNMTAKKDRFTRTLQIKKMRATATDIAVHAFEILPLKGISLTGPSDGDGSSGKGMPSESARSAA